MKLYSLYFMATLYILAGLNHFRAPKFYLKMMPPYLPAHRALVFWSGVAEVVLGVLLFFSATRVMAAWGVIALLFAVFPANFYMYQERHGKFASLPAWGLIVRLPLQLALIAWAYLYTRPGGY